jgi:FdhD protein
MVSEMVIKVCRAGIPLIATKTAVSMSGMDIGRQYGCTVVGFVRDKGTKVPTDTEVMTTAEREMRVYSHPERIIV